MRIVVTGAGGFIGGFLVEALARRGDEVQAWTRDTVDVTDARRVSDTLHRFTPDAVIHLAAQSLPGRSWREPAETYRVNVGGTINLLEAVRTGSGAPRILLAGSSAEYAEPEDGKPIAEDAPIEPNSPYGGSKSTASQLGQMYGSHYGLDILRFRPFSLIGPRKVGDVCSDFARRVVAIERGPDRTMRVGDLTVVRDMIDVRDGVAALIRLLDDGAPGETYNICGGRGTSIADILDAFRRLASTPIEIVQDPALLRPLEQHVKIGDPSKLRELAWAPVYDLEATLADILAYWRADQRGDCVY